MDVEFKDNSAKIIGEMSEAVEAFLYESAELIKGEAANLSRVNTGQLRGSWQYDVSLSDKTATVGSPLQNAVWEEYGTGEYAMKGNGRKGGWVYQDVDGKWHHTNGKKPQRMLFRAFEFNKAAIENRAKQILKGAFK